MAFEALIEVLNSIIKILGKYKIYIRDYDDADWYLDEIIYEDNEDKIYFKCKEEK